MILSSTSIGIYLHIPYCAQACSYCDFYFSTSLKSLPRFIPALLREIELRKNEIPNARIETIYFGGGTPGRLAPETIAAFLRALFNGFEVNPQAEITLEANPDDISPKNCAAWCAAGVNRLSVGIQSIFERELRFMNRSHSAEQALRAIETIQTAGFSNFTIDLIYATPDLTNEEWGQTLYRILALAPPHISAYALTIEPRTLLGARYAKGLLNPAEDKIFNEQFDILIDILENAGYEQYEISNFAQPKFRSKHNSAYWQGTPYIGLGPSAHSFDGARTRTVNVPNVWKYINALENNVLPIETTELLSDAEAQNEYILTRLRTSDGLSIQEFETRFKISLLQTQGKLIENLVATDKIFINDGIIRLTRNGIRFADAIAGELFFETN